MKKSLIVWTAILCICAAPVSFAAPETQENQPVPEIKAGEEVSQDPETTLEVDFLQPAPTPMLNLCTLQCKIDRIDCLELCNSTWECNECYSWYQTCIANC